MNKIVIVLLLWSGVLLSMSPEEKGGALIGLLNAKTAGRLYRKNLFPVFHNTTDAIFRDADIKLLQACPSVYKRIANAVACIVEKGMVKNEGVISVVDLGQIFVQLAQSESEEAQPSVRPVSKKITVNDILSSAREEAFSQQKDDHRAPKRLPIRGVHLPFLVPRD